MTGPRPDRVSGGSTRAKSGLLPYWLKFGITAVALGGMTAAFVLVVLPQRFVLQTGITPSGVSFPTEAAPSQPGGLVLTDPRPLPAEADDDPDEAPDTVVAEVEPDPEPGPAELLWDQVVPLLQADRAEEALPYFEDYLAEHPEDMEVRLEHGVALVRAGRTDEAEEAFRAVAEADDEERARLELARLLAADSRLDEAEALYRDILEDDPSRGELLLELASLLWTDNRPAEALDLAQAVPQTSPVRSEADALESLLEAVLVVAEADPLDLPELARPARARLALDTEGPEAAYRLYAEDVAEELAEPDVLLEWANVFQYDVEDLDMALDALVRRAELERPTGEDRLRLAQLHAWTGEEAEARAHLEVLLDEEPGNAAAWAMLGDLRRWEGARVASRDAYDQALGLDPGEPQALVGREALQVATEQAIFQRQDPGVGPQMDYFRDSEGFRHLALTARASLGLGAEDGVVVRSGFLRLEGFHSGGARTGDDGAFAELELSRFWREGTVRASIEAGAEHLGEFGTQPLFGARIEATELGRLTVEGSYRHGRAYPAVSTLESVDLEIQADQTAVAWSLRMPSDWVLSGSAEAGSFRGAGSDSWRLAAGAALQRQLAPSLRVGAATRVLGFTDEAPTPAVRRAYWDPELFWSIEAPVELAVPRDRGWTGWARLSPGVALARERDLPTSEWVPQLSASGGVRYLGDGATLDADIFHARGREGEYRSLGFSLGLTVRR